MSVITNLWVSYKCPQEQQVGAPGKLKLQRLVMLPAHWGQEGQVILTHRFVLADVSASHSRGGPLWGLGFVSSTAVQPGLAAGLRAGL